MSKTKEDQPLYDASLKATPAGVIKKFIDQFLQAANFSTWFLASITLVALFLITQNYSKENVSFPIFNQFTFNDLLKVLVLMFITFMFVKTIIRVIVSPIFTFLASLILAMFKPLTRLLKKLPRKYTEEEWIADPPVFLTEKQQFIYPQLRHRIPVEVKEFDFIRFNISILKDYPHWRAGIFILGFENNGDYVIHLYKDENDPQPKSKMTKRIFSEGHKKESNKNLAVNDRQNFQFEVKAEDNDFYSLKVNGEEIDRYKIPKDQIKFIEIGAWADDRAFKIKFENIEFKG